MNTNDAKYMDEADRRHSGTMLPAEVGEQYRQIKARPIGAVQPYTPPEEETTALSASTIRKIKVFRMVAPVACISIGTGFGVAHVFMTGALDTVLGWCIGGGVLLAALSGLVGPSTGKRTTGEGNHYHYHYHQNNSCGGGGANQNNGK